MSNSRSLQLLAGGTLLVLLAGCGMFQHEKEGLSAVVGTWTNSIGTVWMIKPDGTFDVDLNHNGKRDAWGKYAVTGDKISLQRTGGINPSHCNGKGVYKFQRDGDNLRFTLVSDACKLRRKNVLTAWRAKK